MTPERKAMMDNLSFLAPSLCQWAETYLNPHQALVVTLDGVKVVGDELGIPNPKNINTNIGGRK